MAPALLATSSQAPAAAQTPPAAPQEKAAPAAAAPIPQRDEKLPASESQAKAALDKTPRHGEYVDVKNPAGGPAVRTWVEYPERKEKAGVVLVIHEIFGLSDWARAVADQLVPVLKSAFSRAVSFSNEDYSVYSWGGAGSWRRK